MALTTGVYALDVALLRRGWTLGALPVIGDAMRLMLAEEGVGGIALLLAGLTCPQTSARGAHKFELIFERIADAYEARPPRGSAEFWAQIGQDMLHAKWEKAKRERIERELERIRAGHKPADALGRASAYLAKCAPGVSGQGRDPQAWSVVLMVVRGFALRESDAVALLETEYAPRCQPRLPSRDVRGMVRRATRASRPPWGCMLEQTRARS